MSDGEQQPAHPEAPEFSLRGKRIRNPKLRRGIFLLPSLFTVGNLLCGYYACVAVAIHSAEIILAIRLIAQRRRSGWRWCLMRWMGALPGLPERIPNLVCNLIRWRMCLLLVSRRAF